LKPPFQHKNNIAVVGGGITGLVGVSKLAELFPNAQIDLYESSDRLGGWVQTQSVDVGDGKVVFEQGPRTLRPHTINGKVTLALVRLDVAPYSVSSPQMLT
jgi:oxygen-dependent protoporphyrinogen oxidase